MNKEKIIQAGQIAKKTKEYAESIIRKNMPLLEIAEKIEAKIVELGAKPAFPTNLSINNVAAHYTPAYDDKNAAHGLLKVDFGVHVDGWLADTAFSIDLEGSELNKKLIEASKKALHNAIHTIKDGIVIKEIGKEIEKAIESFGFSSIINLSGHEMQEYELHAGITIPNIDDSKNIILKKGLYAIEPFASTGTGKVHDGKPSGIYMVIDEKTPRSPLAREVFEFIIDEYQTLPFCSRWIVKKFGARALFALKQLEDNESLHHFPQLVEQEGAIVSQAEDTVFIDKEKILTTS